MTTVRTAITATIVATTLTIGIAQQPVTPGQPTPGVQPGQTATVPGTPPPRMPPRAARPGEDPQKGTAVLRGYVIAADTGAPLRRAMVRATSQDGRGGGVTTTDADGRFEIKELPGGRYSMSASKAGYVMMQYGQRRPEQQGTMLEILDGQLVEKIAFSLPRGGVITGRVTDEFGDPVAGAQVTTLRYRYMNGARRMLPAGPGATTDDLGAFRLFGLVPGEYYVSGTLRTQTMMGPPTASSSIVEGFAPTYYPGTPNPAEAQRVPVKVGQETTNVAFALAAARLARINGRAVTSTGEPIVQGFVNAMLADRTGPMMMMGFMGGTTRADGTFQINGVPAGTYNLRLQPRGMPNTPTEVGQVRVTVGSEDLDNVLIVASRGGVARGVITGDDNTPLPMRPQQANVFVRPSDPDDMMMGSGFARVNDDWTFEVSNLFTGGLISASLAESPDWTFKGVYMNGEDVTDTPLDFGPGQTVEGLQIVFSRRRTELSGGIADERGRPETDATVIIFAEDSNRWTFQSRYIRTARPNQDGRYNLRGMPPHDYYYVVAVREVETGQWQDPEFLESVRDQATRVSLGEGETKVQDLKLAKQ
jgi:hypothetical protein